jgi:hypothetical protein
MAQVTVMEIKELHNGEQTKLVTQRFNLALKAAKQAPSGPDNLSTRQSDLNILPQL